jgi:hypothetical protein
MPCSKPSGGRNQVGCGPDSVRTDGPTLPLSNDSFITDVNTALNSSSSSNSSFNSSSDDSLTVPLVIVIVLVVAIVFALLGLFVVYRKRKRKEPDNQSSGADYTAVPEGPRSGST